MSGKVMHVHFETNMANGHNGLSNILKKSRDSIGKNEFALFINKSWTACKLLTSENVILHLKRPANQPIDPKTIPLLPYCISGTKLDYTKALHEVITQEFESQFEGVS